MSIQDNFQPTISQIPCEKCMREPVCKFVDELVSVRSELAPRILGACQVAIIEIRCQYFISEGGIIHF